MNTLGLDQAGDDETASLLRLAASLGADTDLVQAAGGNVSLKRDGLLWIKASGLWLRDAIARPVLVPVRLELLRHAIETRNVETVDAFVEQDRRVAGLRPSIETTMHAWMMQRIVLHVHCVNTIAQACTATPSRALIDKLDGLDWRFVPYARPGAPLTRAIRANAPRGTSVLVLGNHGLVVGADTVEDAQALLVDVCHRLRVAAREAPGYDETALAPWIAAGYRPACAAISALALVKQALAAARRGSLYPDHVIFLGPGITIADDPSVPLASPMAVVPGKGVVLRADATDSVIALARCLADVARRIDAPDTLNVLTAADEHALLNWEAETYRQSLAKA